MELPKSNTQFQEWVESFINGNKDFVYIENDRYHNKLFGISFEIPRDWYILTYNDFDNAFNQQALVGEFEHFKNELYQCISQPSLLISKYSPASEEHNGIISPVVNFSIIAKEPEFRGLTLTEYADLLESENPLGYNMLKNFRITNKGRLFKKDGFEVILYETEYLFEHIETDTAVMVEMYVWNIDFGDFFLDFSMTECKGRGQFAKQDFQNIIESIRF